MPLDAETLARLIERHAAALALFARRRAIDADDVVQEALCRLAVEEPPPDNPSAWLFRVCRNLADNDRRGVTRRKAREQAAAAVEAFQNDPAAALEQQETVAALEKLSDELREVLVARIWGGMTLEEIGVLCGVSTATASRRYRDALEQMRTKFNPPCEKER